MDTTICEVMSIPMKPAQIMIPELKQLIIYFSKNTYTATVADNVTQDIIQKCLSLIDVDYKYSIVYNATGDICPQYPTHLIILEEEKIDKYRDLEEFDIPLSPPRTEEDIMNKYANINKLKDLMKKANIARCRLRFPLPVIMYKGKHICRSATLSGGVEIYGRIGLDYFFPGNENNSETEEKVDETKQEVDETKQEVDETKQEADETKQEVDETKQNVDETKQKVDETKQKVDETKQKVDETKQKVDETKQKVDETKQKVDETKQKVDETKQKVDETKQKVDETEQKVDETGQKIDEIKLSESSSLPSQWTKFDEVRNKDIELLKTFNVGIIIDLMVEKKKMKCGMPVSSSEKVDKFDRYSDFSLISLPYPGCEFFKGFRENDYIADNLIFDWSQPYVDAKISVPEDAISSQLQIDWKHYQQWDILVLTQNYLKLILRYLSESSNGMLIHCISGWDRTPLFISLLRLSLWADNVIHTSLDAHQMLYYTIAYDWMLFGHNLQDRLSKGEEIFFFCFYFLKYICDEEFSIKQDFNKRDSKSSSSNDDDEIKHPIFHIELATGDLSVSASDSDSNKNSRASRDSKDSQNKYSSPDIIWTNSPPKTEEFSNSDSQIVQPTFTMEPTTGDTSISVSNSDSNRSCRDSRDGKDRELKYSKVFWPDSPSKAEVVGSISEEFEHIFAMELETEDPSISVSSSNSNRNSRASRDDKDSQNKSPPKIIWTNSPPETKEFSNRKAPSLPSSPNKEETAHESSVPHGQTSPVVVPGGRQRAESTTPAGSWQIVTETGSLNDSTITTEQPLVEQPTSSTISKPSGSITDSNRRLLEREILSSVTHFCSSSRKDKLCFLRNAFYTAYSQTGFQMKENSRPGNLMKLIEGLTEMLSSRSTTL